MPGVLLNRDEFLALATFGSVRVANGRFQDEDNTDALFSCAPDFGLIDSNNWLLIKTESALTGTTALELSLSDISSYHPIEEKGLGFWKAELKPFKLRLGKPSLTEAFATWSAQTQVRRRTRLVTGFLQACGLPQETAQLDLDTENRLAHAIASLDGDFGTLSFEIKACLGMSGFTSLDEAAVQPLLSQAEIVSWPHACLADDLLNGQPTQQVISHSCVGLLARIRGLMERGELDGNSTRGLVALIRRLPSAAEAGICSHALIGGLDDAALHASTIQAGRDAEQSTAG